jgi:hypothetical protein
MANPVRGSVALQAAERAYTLSFSINALCELEEQLGQPIAQIATTLGKPEEIRLGTVRALVWAATRDHHPEIDLKSAGDVIDAAGVQDVMAVIGKAFQLAFPAPAEGAPTNPRKAKG